jgi:hypothetical protein
MGHLGIAAPHRTPRRANEAQRGMTLCTHGASVAASGHARDDLDQRQAGSCRINQPSMLRSPAPHAAR